MSHRLLPPVYRVHWGAHELADLAALLGVGSAKGVGAKAIAKKAAVATKAGAKKLAPIANALLAADLAKNPWHVAKSRANKTGAVVADLLARTEVDSYVLVGHSLGARAMVVAAEMLGTKVAGPRIESVHLLGAAIGARSDWDALTARVDAAVYNYHSAHDGTLKIAYGAAELGRTAAGLRGFEPLVDKLVNVDVSPVVDRHTDYLRYVTLI